MTNEITVNNFVPTKDIEQLSLPTKVKKSKKGKPDGNEFLKNLQDKLDEENDKKKKGEVDEMRASCQEAYNKYPNLRPSKEVRGDNFDLWLTEFTRCNQFIIKEKGLETIRMLASGFLEGFVLCSGYLKIKLSPHIKDKFIPTLLENIHIFDDEFTELMKILPLTGGNVWQINLAMKIFTIYKLSFLRETKKEGEKVDESKYNDL